MLSMLPPLETARVCDSFDLTPEVVSWFGPSDGHRVWLGLRRMLDRGTPSLGLVISVARRYYAGVLTPIWLRDARLWRMIRGIGNVAAALSYTRGGRNQSRSISLATGSAL